ncbi:unnamed protein product [Dovyalis caffra]|uniref:UvrD-like helicase ATP-binding domain-containing protein n=1 Tax=Dovyalis caffra TaxID=77055 RepID=A0AAV1R0K6_9ROSI|nr:unnamed protein product [Dovyalis caffra]
MAQSSSEKIAEPDDPAFIDTIFSWSLEDIFNENLFKVEKIPESFLSVQHYLGSYILPLLEETRAQLHSSIDIIVRAPYASVISFSECKPDGRLVYDVTVDCWRNRFSDCGKHPYTTLPGDIVILTDAKPKTTSDLQSTGRAWTLALVADVKDNADDSVIKFAYRVKASKDVAEKCSYCSTRRDGIFDERFVTNLSSKLNESQNEAVVACLDKMQCNHKSSVELIWGPAGTGKTYTVSMLLFGLLRMKSRGLTCAPTTVAGIEVATRVLKLVTESCETESGTHDMGFSLGDLLFFGNGEGLKVDSGIEEIYLCYRVERLLECFGPDGWRHCFTSAIEFFEDCASQYFNEQGSSHENENKDEKSFSARDDGIGECKSFLEFVRERFRSTASPLKKYMYVLRTHIPESFILKQNIENILRLVGLLDSFETLLFFNDIIPEELKKLFSYPELVEDSSKDFPDILLLLCLRRRECLSLLKTLHNCLSELNLPSSEDNDLIEEFCFRTASLIFCTASNSYKLHSLAISPLKFLVIDEATQLKECETAIPLQLPGIRHAILIGDDCQLPAMVESHMYDAPNVNVKGRKCENRYLPGPMFGPYSFINIFDGREELDDIGHSRRNMVEVAIVWKLVQNVYKAWKGSKQKLRIGIISPYSAQVVAIEEKLGQKYEHIDGFSVKVDSVDGFQGGEADIVIISTVRSNAGGAIRFMSNPRRINVALTRARQSLWILGNERTLCQSASDWEVLVHDAQERRCFFNADEDKELARTIFEVKKEFDQLDDLLRGDCALLRCAIWKVHFSEYFRKSFGKLASRIRTYILNFLLKLASGWRPKRRTVDLICKRSSQILKQFKVEGLYIICSIDIVKEKRYTQVLKVWDLLPLEDVPGLLERLDGIFETYTDDFIRRCKEISVEGYKNVRSIGRGGSDGIMENSKVSESLLLMKFYSLSSGVVKHLLSDSDGRELVLPFEVTYEERNIILFQKSTFILGRSGTGKTTVLTMKLTKKEQLHHIATEGFGEKYGNTLEDACWRKNFNDGIELVEGDVEEAKKSVLRQLFVTVSPKLCYAVKQHVSQLLRLVDCSLEFTMYKKEALLYMCSFASGGKYSSGSSSAIEDIDDTALYHGIPDSFVDIPPKSYPLVITLSKFLVMLDLTIGKSYFERFPCVRRFLHGERGNSGSISLLTLIQTREVDFKKFLSILAAF